MQTLKGYGITLSRLTQTDIELVRSWRNAPEIAANMEYAKYITADEQLIWFNQLNPGYNFYFIIKQQNQKIGLIHLNQLNQEELTAHAGLFIAKKNYTGTGVALGASLLLLTFAFNVLNLRKVYAKVKLTNAEAITYNIGLGFVFYKHLNNHFDLFGLTPERFNSKKDLLSKLAENQGVY